MNYKKFNIINFHLFTNFLIFFYLFLKLYNELDKLKIIIIILEIYYKINKNKIK
jgi:hypothetical protein